MVKYHKIISPCIGILALVVLQEYSAPQPIFRFLIPAFFIFICAVTAYNYLYLKAIGKYNLWVLVRPALMLCSYFGLFSIIPSLAFRGIFVIISVVPIALFEFLLGSYAENLLLIETLFIAFGFFLTVFAYAQLPPYDWVLTIVTFGFVAALTRAFYQFVPKNDTTKNIAAIFMGLLCGELFWVLNFLPQHFSVLGLILFNFFYFCLIINYYYLLENLNYKKLQLHLALIVICNILIISVTPWRIIQ